MKILWILVPLFTTFTYCTQINIRKISPLNADFVLLLAWTWLLFIAGYKFGGKK